MKKKKFALRRETLRHLSLPNLRAVLGGEGDTAITSNEYSRCYGGGVTRVDCGHTDQCATDEFSFCVCAE